MQEEAGSSSAVKAGQREGGEGGRGGRRGRRTGQGEQRSRLVKGGERRDGRAFPSRGGKGGTGGGEVGGRQVAYSIRAITGGKTYLGTLEDRRR